MSDQVYERNTVLVEKFEKPTDQMVKSLLSQISQSATVKTVKEALDVAKNNFAAIDAQTVLIKIEDGHFVLGTISKDSAVVKLFSPDHGALLVYRPNDFVRIEATDPVNDQGILGVSPEVYLNALTREKAYQVVEEYTSKASY